VSDDTQRVPDPKGVQTVHAVGKYLPAFPSWNAKVAQEISTFLLTHGLLWCAVVFTIGYLFGLVPERYELP
jgi:hypothetical protein